VSAVIFNSYLDSSRSSVLLPWVAALGEGVGVWIRGFRLRCGFGLWDRHAGVIPVRVLPQTTSEVAMPFRSMRAAPVSCWQEALEVCGEMINNFEQASWHDCSLDALPTRDGRRIVQNAAGSGARGRPGRLHGPRSRLRDR
jgi:hypothetical protein